MLCCDSGGTNFNADHIPQTHQPRSSSFPIWHNPPFIRHNDNVWSTAVWGEKAGGNERTAETVREREKETERQGRDKERWKLWCFSQVPCFWAFLSRSSQVKWVNNMPGPSQYSSAVKCVPSRVLSSISETQPYWVLHGNPLNTNTSVKSKLRGFNQ